MITFNEIGRHGRLGNQLFQIAMLKIISEKLGYEIGLPTDTLTRVHHNQKNLLNYFKLPSIRFETFEPKHGYSETQDWGYEPQIFSIKDDTNIYGYFQNAKYYNDYQNILIKEFELIDDLQNFAEKYLNQFIQPTVSLHVRRGDYSDGSIPSNSHWCNNFEKQSILYEYYNKALKQIPLNSTIFLFTGGSKNNNNKNDIEWCKFHFRDERIIFVDFLNDIECFALMKNCTYNITSFVSSFTWWAAFLNKNNNVIAPYVYHPTNNHIDVENFCPKYWKLI